MLAKFNAAYKPPSAHFRNCTITPPFANASLELVTSLDYEIR